MRIALAEAERGIGWVSPNPAVGAVLVKHGEILARGYHRAPGKAHAEIECFEKAKVKDLKEATLYVTLEPCSTKGRTPPCTDAISDLGLRRVVIGAIDVNPAHAGRGVRELQKNGVEVTTGILGGECTYLNEGFNKWITTGRPLVIAKCAMSLDGRLTRPVDEPRWLTSVQSRRDAHLLRARVDAIVIGANTLRDDNPRLTVRGIKGARQPLRVILSRSGDLPSSAKIFCDRFKDRTLIYGSRRLETVLQDLGGKQITSVLIEGGGDILSQAFDAHLVDKVQFYLAPLFTGGPVRAVGGKGAAVSAVGARLRDAVYRRFGRDICITGYPEWPRKVR